jgi:hypothetical protein
MYGCAEIQLHIFLTWTLMEVEWSASRPSGLTREEIIPVHLVYHIGWPMGPVWKLHLGLYNNKKYFFHFEMSIFHGNLI